MASRIVTDMNTDSQRNAMIHATHEPAEYGPTVGGVTARDLAGSMQRTIHHPREPDSPTEIGSALLGDDHAFPGEDHINWMDSIGHCGGYAFPGYEYPATTGGCCGVAGYARAGDADLRETGNFWLAG